MYFGGYVLLAGSGLLGKNVLQKIVSVVLYGQETWSLKSETNTVPARLGTKYLGPLVSRLSGERSKLFNDDLHNLYPSQNIKAIKTRALPWKGSTARMEVCKNT